VNGSVTSAAKAVAFSNPKCTAEAVLHCVPEVKFQNPLVELLGHGDFDDLLLDGISDKLRLVVDIEFAHQVKFVRLDRLHA
jgi:hypothetical protein